MTTNQCPAKLSEIRKGSRRRDSWRCQLEAGHGGRHVTLSGHRQWTDPDGGNAWNFKGQDYSGLLNFDTNTNQGE